MSIMFLAYAFYKSPYSIKLIALIEYQGEQHFEIVDFFGGAKKFERQQMNDERKRSYCKNKRIPLIEIPYWENIDKYLSQFTERN